jgi:zeaxanthin glucosyltransferase
MTHFGVLSHSGAGHLNPLMALSRQLKARGHRVTFFQKPELATRVCLQGLEFHPIGNPNSSSRKDNRKETGEESEVTFREQCAQVENIMDAVKQSLRDLPAALTELKVDVLIVDEIIVAGPTLAQMLHIPYFIVSTSVPLSFGWPASHRSSTQGVQGSPPVELQNAQLQVSAIHLYGPVRWKLDECRRQVGLGPIQRIYQEFPALAHITQLPRCLDYPRPKLPPNFHYAGPFVDDAVGSQARFSWHLLDHRPLVYMSLGTARAVQEHLFHPVAQACHDLNLQFVITLGGRTIPESFADLPGHPLVVKEAPQLELVKLADIIVTHCGLNTTLEALREGKPILAIPIDHDQPTIADRLARLGAAELLSIRGLSTSEVRRSLQNLLTNRDYRNAAILLQGQIRAVNGLKIAADVIENALENHSSRVLQDPKDAEASETRRKFQ